MSTYSHTHTHARALLFEHLNLHRLPYFESFLLELLYYGYVSKITITIFSSKKHHDRHTQKTRIASKQIFFESQQKTDVKPTHAIWNDHSPRILHWCPWIRWCACLMCAFYLVRNERTISVLKKSLLVVVAVGGIVLKCICLGLSFGSLNESGEKNIPSEKKIAQTKN